MSTTTAAPSTSEASNEKPQDPSTVESSESNAPISAPVPDGGLRAWLVAAGASFIFFSALGYGNSYGVFQAHYMRHQLSNMPSDSIAWIGSITTFLQLLAGGLGGPLFDRFGTTWITPSAAVIFIFALMMVSLCTEYWHFMLAQGVLTGSVMGLLLFPAMGAVMQYFDKKRASALGLVVAGSSVGGVVFPIALSKMLNDTSLSFGWSVRIMAFIMLPCLVFSCLTVRGRLPPRKTKFFISQAFKQADFLLMTVGTFLAFLGMFPPLFFIPAYAESRGVEATMASYLVAIVNGASTFGRIIPGILADKYGRLNVLATASIATGIVTSCLSTATSVAGLVVYSVVFGFTSGAILSGASTAFTVTTKDPREMGTYMGMGMGLISFAALIGPPICGALVDRYGGYLQVSLFGGIVSIAGGIVVLGVKTVTPHGLFGRV